MSKSVGNTDILIGYSDTCFSILKQSPQLLPSAGK